MKRVISIAVMLIVMFSSFPFNVSAESVSLHDSRYLYTNYCSSTLTISGSTATCVSEVKGYYGETTKIEITQSFEELLSNGWWYRHQSWSNTFYTWFAYYENSTSVPHSGTYHVRTTAKVYAGSNYENISMYSSNVTV